MQVVVDGGGGIVVRIIIEFLIIVPECCHCTPLHALLDSLKIKLTAVLL